VDEDLRDIWNRLIPNGGVWRFRGEGIPDDAAVLNEISRQLQHVVSHLGRDLLRYEEDQ
jgi:hypothetical protein